MAVHNATATRGVTFRNSASAAAPVVASVQPEGFVVLDLRGDGATATVSRLEPGGAVTEVRGSPFPLDTVTTVGLAFDYEFPFDTPIRYRILSGGITTESNTVTVPSEGRDWLRSLSTPSRSLAVEVVEFDGKDATGRVSLYQVHGRREPVAVTDVLSAYTGTITLYAEGSDVVRLADLLSDGYPIMFHSPPEHGEDRFYFVATGVKWQRVSRLAHDQGRYLELTVAEVDSSRLILGVSPTQYTWASLTDDYPDWAAVVADFPTWRDVVTAGLTLPGV